mgnify:CR=1 FL=1
MVPFLYTAREHHGVPTAAALRRRHQQAIALKARAGMRYTVHTDPQPVQAFVSAGSWVVVCPSCGSGCATDPAWGLACCFGCGAVFERVVFPSDPAAIEAALVERVHVPTRNWQPSESVADLRAENVRFGGRRR